MTPETSQVAFPNENPTARAKLTYHLGRMIDINLELYTKILDTPNFAFHFNEILNLARTGNPAEATCRYCPICGLPLTEQTDEPWFQKEFGKLCSHRCYLIAETRYAQIVLRKASL